MSLSTLRNPVTLALLAAAPAWASALVLDDFSAGNITVTSSVGSTAGQNVPGVFGDNRGILLLKEVEDSATSVSVGAGVLTWNETGRDYASVVYGTATTEQDLSGYDAFRIDIVSAPPNAGTMDFTLWYRFGSNQNFGVTATVAVPGSGLVDVPFASLRSVPSFPPLDLTRVGAIVIGFPGDTARLAPGTYVLDDFQAVLLAPVPEPPAWALAGLGALAVMLKRRRHAG